MDATWTGQTCPFLGCVVMAEHTHPCCGVCGAVRYGNMSCPACVSVRSHDLNPHALAAIELHPVLLPGREKRAVPAEAMAETILEQLPQTAQALAEAGLAIVRREDVAWALRFLAAGGEMPRAMWERLAEAAAVLDGLEQAADGASHTKLRPDRSERGKAVSGALRDVGEQL